MDYRVGDICIFNFSDGESVRFVVTALREHGIVIEWLEAAHTGSFPAKGGKGGVHPLEYTYITFDETTLMRRILESYGYEK